MCGVIPAEKNDSVSLKRAATGKQFCGPDVRFHDSDGSEIGNFFSCAEDAS